MKYRDQLSAFYQKHNPAKLGEVDALLRTFAGREELMFNALRAKYEGEVSTHGRGSSSSAKSVTAKSTLTEAVDEGTVQEELQRLLREMRSVDLEKLLSKLRGRTTVEGDLLVHTVMFMQHFATCASRFQELSTTLAPPEAVARQNALTQTENSSATARCDATVQACVTMTTVVTQTGSSSSDDDAGVIPCRENVNNGEEPNLDQAHVPPTYADFAASLDDVPAMVQEGTTPHLETGAVYRVQPEMHRKTEVIGALLTSGQLRSAETIVLQPGVYHENLYFMDSGEVELVAAFPGALVIIKPLTELEPLIRAEGSGTRLRISGVVLVEHDADGADTLALDPSMPCKPLVAVSAGAQVDFHGCHLYQGGCAVEAMDPSTMVHMHLCVLSSCMFAGVFLHHCAKVIMSQCKLKQCETGIRMASKSSLHAQETVIDENTTDGIVGYEGVVGMLERCSVLRNGGNGIFLSTGSTLSVVESTVELNGLYGIQRLQGSTLHMRGSVVRDNALLPINDTLDASYSEDT